MKSADKKTMTQEFEVTVMVKVTSQKGVRAEQVQAALTSEGAFEPDVAIVYEAKRVTAIISAAKK